MRPGELPATLVFSDLAIKKALVQDTSLEGLRPAYKRQYFNEDESLA